MAYLAASLVEEHIESLLKRELYKMDLLHLVSEVRAVQSELKDIKEFLGDDQQKTELVSHERTSNEQVRSWLTKVRRIAYDAEDVIDIYYSDTQKYSGLSLGLNKIYSAHHASKELRRLCGEIQEMKAKLIDYNEGHVTDSASSTADSGEGNTADSQKEKEGSLSFKGHRQADDDFVVGIENDMENIVKMLTSVEKGKDLQENNDHPDVLAVVGMGGSGKTTLARNIYNHPKVLRHFKYRAWVTLPRGWDTSKVVSEISRQLFNNKSHVVESVPKFVNLIRNLFMVKKCLIVLDNVWDRKLLQDMLPEIIQHGSNDHHGTIWDRFKHQHYKTKFLITSRHRLETFNINNSLQWPFHEVQLLNEEDGLNLFNKVTSSNHGKELAKEYRGLAVEMLKKCEGLPLPIVALGKLLRTKDTIQDWEKVFSQLVRKVGPTDIYLPVNDILALSYHDLHFNLKPCFLYFGLFPEDFPIKAETLMRMWVAEGFIQRPSNRGERWEVAARDLLQNLIDHTMVQVVKKTYSGKVKILRILGMMRDLCIKEAQELDFLTVSSSESNQIVQKNSRRAAVNFSKCYSFSLENPHLRSLFLHEYDRDGKHGDIINGTKTSSSLKSLNQQASLNLALVFEKLKLLRVLDINGIKTSNGVMPKEIGNLIHLRYLRIRSTNISELPKSIGKLRKLLTLDYWNVYVDSDGIKLPNVLWKLRNLRQLYLPYEMSNTMENFKLNTNEELETLWGVRGGEWMIKEMDNLSSKLHKLCIQGISSSEQIESLFNSPVIRTHDNLYSLALDWYGFSLHGSCTEALCTKLNLKKLKLMGNAPNESNPLQFPCNLGKIELYYTQLTQPESLKALGELKFLKFLRLAKQSFVGSEWKISSKELFPQLEVLKLSNLLKLEEWEVAKGAMPCLKKLSIVSCTYLKQMPEEFVSIRKLRLKIEHMPRDFKSTFEKFKDLKVSNSGAEYFNIIPQISNIAFWDFKSRLFEKFKDLKLKVSNSGAEYFNIIIPQMSNNACWDYSCVLIRSIITIIYLICIPFMHFARLWRTFGK